MILQEIINSYVKIFRTVLISTNNQQER